MIETLNRDCFCVSLDPDALRRAIEADPAAHGLHQLIEERCPHLFAARLYQGQTTNLRTAGGGFAPVLTTPPSIAQPNMSHSGRSSRSAPIASSTTPPARCENRT
jgi:hypothetical protein